MPQIVVAFDATAASKKALEKAISLLGEDDEILLVSIMPSAKIAEFKDIDPGTSMDELREAANRTSAELRARGIRVVAVIKEGDVIEELLEIADDTRCSMLVVGKDEMSKVGRFALGSIAETIHKRAKRPVLIVK